MNLLEAVKSGKSFRRNPRGVWFKSLETHIKNRGTNYSFITAVLEDESGEDYPIGKEDILAEDWVVKEELLPCPFCGEKVKYIEGWVGVDCPTLDCIFHMHEKAVPVCKDKFLKSWNNRRFIVGKW